MIKQIIKFKLNNIFLGIDVLLIREINRKIELTSVPTATDNIRGLMNLRGKIVTVIDLNVCLNESPTEITDESRLLIMKTDHEIKYYQNEGLLDKVQMGDDIVGFVIDTMGDVLDIDEDDILPTPPNLDMAGRELIDGVIKLEDNLIMLLYVTKTLEKVLV